MAGLQRLVFLRRRPERGWKQMGQFGQKANAYGYLIAAACFSIQAIGIGIYVAFGVFFNPLMAEFGWSRAAISGASSVAFFNMGIFGILIGRLNDRFGPRRLMTATAVLLGLGYGLMFKVTTLWQLYLFYGLIFGIGLSSIDVIALTTVARWFARNRGMMTGIVKVGTGTGQFTLPLLASALILNYGWRQAYLLIGAAAMVSLVIIAQVLRRDPGQTGCLAQSGSAQPACPTTCAGPNLSLSQAVTTIQLWTICLANLTLVFCLMIVLVHIVPHARDIGVSAAQGAMVLSAIGGMSIIGRISAGLAIDRIGSKNTMLACFILLISGMLWLQVADRLWMLYLFAGVYGMAHGGFFTAISPIVAELFGITAHGVLFGIVVCFGTTGGAVGPLLAGHLFDISASYQSTFWMISAMSVLSLGLLLTLKPVAAPAQRISTQP
jgi:MFS family permease